jgi:energy-coupling factor transporter ATP-binding protein EcfA2
MEQGIIPALGKGSSVVLVGRSGSGKSVLLSNLLTRPEFYGTYFKPDNRFLYSPTADIDSVADEMNIPKKNRVIKDMKCKLETLWKTREQEVKRKGGAHMCEPLCVVFDDLTGNNKLQNSKVFIRYFTAGRHLGILSFVCVHKISALKRVCRLNTNYIFIFQSTNTEVEVLLKEQRPSTLTKEQFEQLIKYCWTEPHSFMYIDNTQPEKSRYRMNLDKILELT